MLVDLSHAIEHGMILEETSFIQTSSLPITIRTPAAASGTTAPIIDGMSLPDQERRLPVQALSRCGGNQTQAARLLRITRDTLRYKVKKFNLS